MFVWLADNTRLEEGRSVKQVVSPLLLRLIDAVDTPYTPRSRPMAIKARDDTKPKET